MYARPQIPRGVLRLAVAASAVLSLSACVSSAIDRERRTLAFPPAAAARAAAEAQLALVRHQTRHVLNLDASLTPRPAASRGAFHDSYRRWVEGQVQELPDPEETAGALE